MPIELFRGVLRPSDFFIGMAVLNLNAMVGRYSPNQFRFQAFSMSMLQVILCFCP